jgi:hypothetical protein
MLNQVVDYEILNGTDQSELSTQVKSHIASGWVPSGPLMDRGGALLQVMLKFGNSRES